VLQKNKKFEQSTGGPKQMNTVVKKIKAAFLIIGVGLSVMFGSTQQSQAAYFDNYYSYYQNYLSYYNQTGNAYYYYTGYAFYYYYLAGYYADLYAFDYDPYGNYSDRNISSSYYSSFTYHDIYYNYYADYGDVYYRYYHSVTSR
jgi:hypothetical protein